MDQFYTQKTCDRCGGSLVDGRIMSMLNTDCLCLACKKKERAHPKYKEATGAELEAVRQGNYNYKGLFKK